MTEDARAPQLRPSEDLEDLFENAPCGYLSAEPGGRITKVNRTLSSWLEYEREQLVGRRFQDLLNIAGKIYHETHFAPLLRMQGFLSEVALDLVGQGGRVLPVLVNAVERRDDAGELRFIRITVFNASDRRRYERELLEARRAAETANSELRKLNLVLEARVAEAVNQRLKTEELLRQSQKMEAVGQLTGGVAHDFNNLLTIIRSSVEFLRRPELPEERKQRYLAAVSDTVERAAKLTSQLLAFARRQALKPEVFDVGPRLRSVAEMLDSITGARIHVLIEVPATACFVRADISQFETALINMAVNARDAMDGQGTLTLRLACGVPLPPIRGHAGAPGRFAALSLTDTGSGISSDQIGRIFEPFFTTKEVGQGTGLGLSQVFGFAKQSGGDVAVASARGEGTTFTLYLPETGAPHEQQESESDASVSPAGVGQRVLLVEDNIEVGHFAAQILQDLGFETTWAANAEEALDTLGPTGAAFDAVFSDVMMPGIGGIELAKMLRVRMPDLPVVLTSGYSDVLAQEGTHGFELLHKPYSIEQVSRVLSRATGRRRRRTSTG
ncbi:ATP-binding protein [Methylobacterium sp. CM6257]